MVQNKPLLFQVILFGFRFSLLLRHCHRWLRFFSKLGHLVMQGMCYIRIFNYCLQGVLVVLKVHLCWGYPTTALLKKIHFWHLHIIYCDHEGLRLFWGNSVISWVVVSILCSIIMGGCIKYVFLFIGRILFIVWLTKGLVPFIKNTGY